VCVCVCVCVSSFQTYWLILYSHVTVHRKKFPFNKQPDALIIQIYSVIKLHCFGHLLCPLSRVLHCTFGIVNFHTGFDDRFQAEIVLGSGHQNLHENYQCRMYSRKLLMMDREDARNI